MRINKMPQEIKEYVRANHQRKKWLTAVTCLASVVVFCTVYALILPAITLEGDVYCGKTEHTHSDACYEEVLTCTLEEGEGHTHSEDCYELTSVLMCGQEEAEGHSHTEECYDGEGNLLCELEETEGHTHTSDCYGTEKILVCQENESEGHTHSEACYESVLSCGLEEHTHTDECYIDTTADVETADEWKSTLRNVALTGVWADDLVAIAESQLGYKESTANYSISEDGETKGYTRYGAWYGTEYGESSESYIYENWDAMFISFCLNYADISESMVPREADVEQWVKKLSGNVKNYEGYDLYVKAGDYTPAVGDLVFFDTDDNKDGIADHAGIVTKYTEDDENNTITLKTIEGDADNQVKSVTYDLRDSKVNESIIGYASLPENPETEITELDVNETEETEEIDETSESEMSESETEDDGIKYDELSGFYLWLKLRDVQGTIQSDAIYNNPEWNSSIKDFDGSGIKGALKYVENDETYYLIPISYFTENYANYGYKFNSNETGACPFVYAPNAYAATANLTPASYVYVADKAAEENNSGWYVKVQDTTGLSPNRSNIYYTYYNTQDEVNLKLTLYRRETILDEYENVDTSNLNPLSGVLKVNNLNNGSTNYYLIPVSYFADVYKDYGYTFDYTDICSIQYGDSESNLTRGSYVQVEETWYVKVEDSDGSCGIYYQSDNSYSEVSGFRLWLHLRDAAGNTSATAIWGNQQDWNGNKDGITDALQYTADNGEIYYLIPVSYFKTAYKTSYGYTFDANDTDDCPFIYAPDANDAKKDLTPASYVQVGNNWYVQVQDTGIYNNDPKVPRCNVYYTCYNVKEDDDFALTMYARENIFENYGEVIGYNSDGEAKLEGILQVYDVDNNATNSYLIPIDCFNSNYRSFGYEFSAEDTENCPIRYKASDDGQLSGASYVYIEEKAVEDNSGWYVKVETDTKACSVYYQSSDVVNNDNGKYSEVTTFKLWLKLRDLSGAIADNFIYGNENVADVLKYVDQSETTWYLIPINYFINNYGSADENKGYGFVFKSDESCPFVYAPDAAKSSENLTQAEYVQLGENWYVKVQDTGTYGDPPRSNIYYTYSKTEPVKLGLQMNVKDSSAAYRTLQDGSTNIIDALQVLDPKDGATNYYLIPAKYFETVYGESEDKKADYGYRFSDTNVATCPFKFETGIKAQPDDQLMIASYVPIETDEVIDNETVKKTEWYVMVQGESQTVGSETIPCSSVYYVTVVKDTVSPNGTVINLFDYWVTGRIENDIDTFSENYTLGINAGHALKFKPTGLSEANTWTESKDVYSGIVSRLLSNGYPVLSGQPIFGNENGELVASSESLAYLFDADSEYSYRQAYKDVKGLLQIDDKGFYYYDSKQNYAEFNGKSFELYNDWAVTYTSTAGAEPYTTEGQFFPFNDYETVSRTSKATDMDINHYMGMSLTARFIQKYGGHTDSARKTDMIFEFSGDDDVWIFIDNVLVADLGGIHDEADVKIDFSTGQVTVNGKPTNTIKEAFEAAGKASKDSTVGWNGGTFADYTTHVLKFFYLERGSYASDLKLMYNLKEVPESSIVKVDQYGKPVLNAHFSLYTAKKEYIQNEAGNPTEKFVYKYKLDKLEDDDEDEYISLDELNELNYTILYEDATDKDGNIIKKGIITFTKDGKERTITPIYYGKTDDKGNMTFFDEDGLPLGLDDLKIMSGGSDHFILREVVVPDGYRLIADEIWLYLQNNILYCDNVYSSGAWAAATALLTATDTIYISDIKATTEDKNGKTVLTDVLAKYAKNHPIELSKDESGAYNGFVGVKYYDAEKEDPPTNGTLFAVVLRYGGSDKDTSDLSKLSSWTPIYGNGLSGYTLHKVKNENGEVTRNDFVQAVIDVANILEGDEGKDFSDAVFTMGSSGSMQLLLKNLPGDLKSYYSTLLDSYYSEKNIDEITDTTELDNYIIGSLKYSVAYYWTTADSLAGATVGNTFRVEPYTVKNYSGFDRTFGASIEVPDLVNRLFVQKLDEDGDLVNGATFAMYQVGQEAGKNDFYYVAADNIKVYLKADSDGDNNGEATVNDDNGYSYSIDNSTGVITIQKDGENKYTIEPVDVQKTVSDSIAGEAGTAVFGHRSNGESLEQGYYIVREIAAPAGYNINTAEVQVLVDDTAVYANAGTADDGVTVARGPGYVVSTMQQFASYGDLDNTLTWVYERMKVSNPTTSFAEVYNAANWQYLESYSGKAFSADTKLTDNADNAMTTHLIYGKDTKDTLFNYTINTGWYKANKAESGNVTRRLYTSVGWSYYLLYQDYEYGSSNVKTGANYTDLRENGDISNLFSRSTYVQVADKYSSKLTVKKVSSNDTNKVLSGAEFTLTRTVGTGEDAITYNYVIDQEGKAKWVLNGPESEAPTVLITDENGLINITEALLAGEYKLTEVKAPDGYVLMEEPITFTVANGAVQSAEVGADGGYVITVKNDSGYELPNTGGTGIKIHMFTGLILLFGAGIGLMLKNRKYRKGV